MRGPKNFTEGSRESRDVFGTKVVILNRALRGEESGFNLRLLPIREGSAGQILQSLRLPQNDLLDFTSLFPLLSPVKLWRICHELSRCVDPW
jgi:hypothetical protein